MKPNELTSLNFLKGGGLMGELVRTKDWSKTSLGTPDQWPQSLRTSVSLLLNSRFPMFVWWGKEKVTIYNDAYMVIAGEKHPAALGEFGSKVWAEIWDVVGPLADQVLNEGLSTWAEDQLLYVNRRGYLEETYFTFSYSPILDEEGKARGVFCACTETTDKVLAARKIRDSEKNLRNIILQSPVAMCILKGPKYIVDIANERMFEIWGKQSAVLLGKPLFEGLPEAQNQGFEELLQQVLFEGISVSANEITATLPREGSVRPVFLNFVYEPLRDGDNQISGVIAVAIDVSDQVNARKRIEESEIELQLRVKERTAELQKQNNLLDNILVNSSNGISVTEMIRDQIGQVVDARTILANDAAVKFTGLPREIYLTKTAVELDPGIIGSPYYYMCIKTLETGEPSIIQYYLEYTQRWLELTVSRMDRDHLIHIFTDVTPMKEAQLHLERTIDELKRSNVNLEEFAYAASHDLKEPIRKIQLFSDRLKQQLHDTLSENQRMLFGRMEHATYRMRSLIDDLLAYSHVSGGLSGVEEINLNQKVQRVLEDLELEIDEKKAEVVVGELPVIRGHRRQMQQLFQNLLGNSLKYSKAEEPPVININSLKLKGTEAGIALSAEELHQNFHLIEVRDNGIGFNQEDADRIFNVFTRLHGASEYRGTGVGLSIAKKVVQNHNGYIWANSEPGKGARFSILLPDSIR